MKKYHYEDVSDLKVHLQTFLLYYKFQKPLKALKYKNPWQMIGECYSENPESFWRMPNDKNAGLNRSKRTRNCGSRTSTLAMVYKLLESAQKRWKRIRGFNLLTLVVNNVHFKDGVQVKETDQSARKSA